MNLQPYRQSFTVFVAASDLSLGREVTTTLNNVGYTSEHRVSIESLLQEIFKNPPHIIILFYDDAGFFSDDVSYISLLEKLQKHLPEVHILFLVNAEKLEEACDLYKEGVYDCLVWPTAHSAQLLRAVDRAAETDYYMYLNEQLKDRMLGQTATPTTDFTVFDLFVKEIESENVRSNMVERWMREASRIHDTSEALYMNYIDTKKSLVVTHALGFAADDLRDVGLDLAKEEPGFEAHMLKQPEKVVALHQFVLRGLLRREALYYALMQRDQVQGVFILPARDGQMFTVHQTEHPYLKMCLHLVSRQIEFCELKERLQNDSVHDVKSGALNFEFFRRKITEEISRARRIMRPVSLIHISVDGFDDMTLYQTQSVADRMLKGIADVLSQNSRLNDMVARLSKDHFLLCLPHTDKKGAAIKAERLRRIFASADFSAILGPAAKVSISVGVSEYPGLSSDAENLLRASETAMYEARQQGGNRIALSTVPTQFVPDFVV